MNVPESMTSDKHTYPYKLDFLYQSIAVYAGVLVLYLVVRGLFINKEFPIIWKDPVLYLLSIITVMSIVALMYNSAMKRRIVIEGDQLEFLSRVRKKVIDRSNVEWVKFGRERVTASDRTEGVRVVTIRLRDRRRPVRIRPLNFEHSKRLFDELHAWAGPLKTEGRRRLSRRPV